MQANKYLRLHHSEEILQFFFTVSGASYADLSEHNRRGKLNEDNSAIYDITLGTYCPQEIQVKEDRYLKIDQQNIFEYTLTRNSEQK